MTELGMIPITVVAAQQQMAVHFTAIRNSGAGEAFRIVLRRGSAHASRQQRYIVRSKYRTRSRLTSGSAERSTMLGGREQCLTDET